jgi:hypothetical protein
MNYRNIFFIFLVSLFSLVSCQKDDFNNEEVDKSKGKIILISGDEQSGIYDEYLNKTIKFEISPENEQRKFYLTYIFTNEFGYGKIEQENYISYWSNRLFPDESNVIELKWKLGNFPEKQMVKFFLYADSVVIDQPYSDIIYHKVPCDSIIVTANPIKPKGWVRAYCETLNENDFQLSSLFSYDDETLYAVLNGYRLFLSKDGGNSWLHAKTVPSWDDVKDVKFNSKGWMYVQTRYNGIFYSKDQINWQAINNGILDYRYPTTFFVDDDVLMTSHLFDGIYLSTGPYLSTNNGQSWKKLLVVDQVNDHYYGGNEFHHATRENGNILYIFDKWGNFYKSENMGDNWERINIKNYTNSTMPNDFKIGKNGLLYIGTYDAQLSIISSTTYTGEIYKYYGQSHVSQNVQNITVTDDDVFYLVVGAPNDGLYSKSNDWGKIDLGFSQPISSYYIRKDNTYILTVPSGGIYYYNE